MVSPTARASSDGNQIYRAAHERLMPRLWQAALGAAGTEPISSSAPALPAFRLAGGAALDVGHAELPARDMRATSKPVKAPAHLAPDTPLRAVVRKAAERSGVPAPVLEAIIGAEAGGTAGNWNVRARNPRSSAAGLGQFLSGTWIAEAERPGTALNSSAHVRGALDASGRVRSDARDAVLEWRFDPQLAIEAVADFAKDNLRRLGVAADGAADQVGRAAYLAHHLGLAGARRYLGHGLGEMQAGLLLAAQIGADAANRAVAEAGSAVTAHRRWLEAFVGRKIVQPLAELPPSGAEGFMRRTSG